MATRPVKPPAKDPLARLSIHPFCDYPDVYGLTPEQQCALHEFFHTVLAAGYRMYQVVPPPRAGLIIKKKFGMMAK